IALDVTVTISLVGTGLEGDLAANRDAARFHVLAQLRDGVATLSTLKTAELLGLITAPSTFTVDALSYTGEYLTAGVKLNGISPEIPLTAQELAWIRNVKVAP
ncbi:hypothetical protein, partial [Hyalangium sp.]|uniref:hypothetical protein n=1 Tax=Hyalangium sp. TaxID=2028555 RepID=UPI002D67325C